MSISSPHLRVLSVEINREELDQLSDQLQHGQLTALMRKFISSLNRKFDSGESSEFTNWLYHEGKITLE